MKKLKKKNLLLMLATIFSLGFAVNVNADAPTTNNCKDGKIYTNIYYFLDANVCQDTDKDCTGSNPFYTTDYITQGYYDASKILGSISADDLDANFKSQTKLNISMGQIDVVSGSTDTGLEKMSINTFFTNFLRGDTNDNRNNTYHIVDHTWQRKTTSGIHLEELSNYTQLEGKTVTQLANASIKTTTPSQISYVNLRKNSNDKKEFTFQIERYYSSGLTKYTGNSFAAVTASTSTSSTEKNWYLNPGVYYVQYCEKGTGSNSGNEDSSVTNKLTYDKNTTDTVTDMPDPLTVDYPGSITLATDVPKRPGYTFLGWHTDKTASEGKYNPGDTYNGSETVLYAIWRANSGSYTVSYNAGKGGSDAPASQTGTSGSCVTISDAGKMTNSGQRFLGWSTKEGAVEADSAYAPGKQYCGANGDIRLYAVWSPKTGIVTHVIAFVVTAVIAGAALIVAKKKDLFRQI